jgi:hypothetical protein
MGPAVDKHPHYLEPYLDLKADLDRRTPSVCQPVPKYRLGRWTSNVVGGSGR